MRYTPILLALLGSLATSHGYVLDSSCDTYRSAVIDVMKGAFDLAEKGRDALSDVASGNSPEDPKTQAHSDLVSWLFADVKASGSDPNYQTAFNKFSSVLGYNTNEGQPETTPPDYKALSTDKVAIFCDYKRFAENKDCNGNPKKGYVCDTKMGVYWPMNDIYKDCKKHGIFSSSAVQAWTYEFASKGARKASEIQLCPDFLKELPKSNIKTLNDQGTESALARSWKKLSNFLDDPMRTPIDVAYTFDATLLHEMTHAIPNAATADLDEGDCYGWKKCKKLAKAGTNNADSYAIFGLAAQMISQQGQRPMEDGSVKALPAPPAKRGFYRSLLSRADDPEGFLSSTGRPHSTFRTSTRASSGVNSLPSSGQPGNSPVVAPTSGSALPGGPSSTTPPATSPTRPASTGIPPDTSQSSNPASSGVRPDTSQSSNSASSGVPPDTSQSSNPASSGIPPAASTSSGEPVSPSSSSSHAAAGTSTSEAGPSSTPVTAGSPTYPASITSMPQGSSVSTVTSGSSTIPIPMTVIDVTNSDTTTPVTYISTKTSVDDGQPTAAWMCTGPLCNTGCKVPIFCDSPDLGSSWGLCCGFSPPALPDGTLPPPGGPPPPSDGGDETTPDDDSTSSTSESTTESSSETSSETTSESTTSSTTATTSSSGITSSSTTSTSAEPVLTEGPIGDRFLAWDPAMPSWYQVQESVLSALIADTTDPYITWTPSATASADTSSSSKPPTTSSSTSLTSSTTSESTSSTPTETSSSSKPPIGSPSTPVSTSSTSTETSSSTTEESTSSNPPTGSPSVPVTASPTDSETSSPSPTTTPPPSTTNESPDTLSSTTTIFPDSNNEYGEVLYYTSLSHSILDVYTLSMTLTTGAGDPTTLQTAMPSATSIDNDGSSQCHNLSKDMCVEAAEGFKNDAEDSDNPYELLTGRTDHSSSDKWVALFDYKCIAVLECDDDSPGMSGLQAYKALQDMFDQDETKIEKCGHSYLDNGCVVRTDYHFNY